MTFLQQVRRDGKVLAPAWVGVLLWVCAFGFLVTRVVDGVWPFTLEDDVNQGLEDSRGATWDGPSEWATRLGDTTTIVALLVVTVVLMRLVWKTWREAIYVVVSTAGQSIIFTVAAVIVGRERPDVVQLDDSPPTSSFPSGHTGAAFTYYISTAVAIATHTRRRWLKVVLVGLSVLAPLAVAMSRMYRGMHHPTDIVAAFVLGTLWLVATTLVLLRAGHADDLDADSDVKMAGTSDPHDDAAEVAR